MILVFGGTTEGLRAVSTLEVAGSPYYYSTRFGEQSADLHHGVRLCGAMDREAIVAFCGEHDVRLLIDAAHPFATSLHANIASAAEMLSIPAIRYERPAAAIHCDGVTWVDSYAEAIEVLRGCHTVLATTGVQSIAKFRPLKDCGCRLYYRILRRDSSLAIASAAGALADDLCFYGEESDEELFARLNPDGIVMKESGDSGGTADKVAAALHDGSHRRVVIIRRPALPSGFVVVTGVHGLRRAVEKLLPPFFPLHSGLTTGTIATAASIAAVLQGRGECPSSVAVTLPDGEAIDVPVGYVDGYGYAIKESGDDPDVTDGVEIRAQVHATSSGGVTILGGAGVGVFTLPGFDYPPGEAAINHVPRRMITENILSLFSSKDVNLAVTISVVGGEEIARRTFNPRLGIVGGISIVGSTGIVMPYSEEGFLSSIRQCLCVAQASGSERLVLYSGAKSERVVRSLFPTLPQQCFVEYGNYIGDTLKMVGEVYVSSCIVTLCIMLGKAIKLAAGALDTHSRRSTMDRAFIARLLGEVGCSDIPVDSITLARELWGLLPKERLEAFASAVIAHCHSCVHGLLPPHISLTILLIRDDYSVQGTAVY